MILDFFYDFEHWKVRLIDRFVFVLIILLLGLFFKKVIKFDDKTTITLSLTVGSVFYFHCLLVWHLNFGKIIIDLFQ